VTFTQAQDEFRAKPSKRTAGTYREATTYEGDDMISDDTFHNAIAEVTYWLLYDKQQDDPS